LGLNTDELLKTQPYKGFPIVTDTRDAILLGYISRSELRFALDQARLWRKFPPNTDCYFTDGISGNINLNSSSSNNDATTATRATTTADAEATAVPVVSSSNYVDLRPWMDQTPITLPSRTNLLLVANLFQKLGLRYIIFASGGQLQGLLTKKDAWFILNSAREEMDTSLGARDGGGSGGLGGNGGVGQSGFDGMVGAQQEERGGLLDHDSNDEEDDHGLLRAGDGQPKFRP